MEILYVSRGCDCGDRQTWLLSRVEATVRLFLEGG
jgi:hypothetical protein